MVGYYYAPFFMQHLGLLGNLRLTLTDDFEVTLAMLKGQRGGRGTTRLEEVYGEAKMMFEEGI